MEQKTMALHRARFVDWAPTAIVAIAPTMDGAYVAVAREDGTIELYDAAGHWTCDRRIPGAEGASITSIIWCYFPQSEAARSVHSVRSEEGSVIADSRMFTAGLDARIVEWDWNTLSPRASSESYGGPVWKLAAEPIPKGNEQVRHLR
jgi:U3 small nucleolar RNA-associated protein 4